MAVITDFNKMTVEELKVINDYFGYGFIVEAGRIRGIEFEKVPKEEE